MDKQSLEKPAITGIDICIGISVLICVLTASILNFYGLKASVGEVKLEVIQKMTAAIACLLCCQGEVKASWNAGVNRLIITAVGGATGILAVLISMAVGNDIIMASILAVLVMLTLFLCKLCRVPYINCRIGGVTFILVSSTLNGTNRIWYALFRFVSTLYGALIVMLVTCIYCAVIAKKKQKAAQNKIEK